MAVDNKTRDKVIRLRAEGFSYQRISVEAGVAKQTAVNIAKENIDQIATLQSIEEEAFFEEKKIDVRGRIEQLLALHTRLREEIDRRDLSEVPTDKLVTLLLKTQDALKGEVYAPVIKSTEEQEKARRERSFFSCF